MTTRIKCRRGQRRHSAAGSDRAWVEFRSPQAPDAPQRLPLVDISVSGFSFSLEEGSPRLGNGLEIAGVRIHLGGCEIRGDMVVMHVTPRGDGRVVCGALFYAAGDEDLLKLRSAVAGMEALG